MDYVIFTDTSANLPDKVVREYGLRLIPFFYCPPEHPEGIPCLEERVTAWLSL